MDKQDKPYRCSGSYTGVENMRARPPFVVYLIGSRLMVERFRQPLSRAKNVSNLITMILEAEETQIDIAGASQDQGGKPRSQDVSLALVITDTALDKRKLREICRNHSPYQHRSCCTAILRVGTKAKAKPHISAKCAPSDLRTIVSLFRRNLELTLALRRKQALVKSISSIANCDPLTGLVNRRGWKIAIKRLWREAVEKSLFLLVALFDLDGFKKINDQFGHAFGDQVLKSVAKKAQEACREGDLLARWGGDEIALAVLLPEKSVACQIVERIRSGLQSVFPPMNVPVTASAGYLVVQPKEPWSDKWEEKLLNGADAALARAKTSRTESVCEGIVDLSAPHDNSS